MKINSYIIPGLPEINRPPNPWKKAIEMKTESMDLIIQTVCRNFNTTFEAINIKCRKREVVIVRHAIMYWMRQYTCYSLKQIGLLFMSQDHSTILNGVYKYQILWPQVSELTKIHYLCQTDFKRIFD